MFLRISELEKNLHYFTNLPDFCIFGKSSYVRCGFTGPYYLAKKHPSDPDGCFTFSSILIQQRGVVQIFCFQLLLLIPFIKFPDLYGDLIIDRSGELDKQLLWSRGRLFFECCQPKLFRRKCAFIPVERCPL